MISKPANERASKVLTATGAVLAVPCAVSAISIYGGTAATGGTVVLDDSAAGGGTSKWTLAAPQHGCASITFSRPIPFATGCYATITGTAPQVSVAYD